MPLLRWLGIARLEGRGRQLTALVFDGGTQVDCDALFFDLPTHPQSELAVQLGCGTWKHGALRSDRHAESTVPGVYVAGNITGNVQLAIVAAAEGAQAAFGIYRSLTREEFAAGRGKGSRGKSRARLRVTGRTG